MTPALILPHLPALIKSATDIWDYIRKVRAAAQQSGEWTTEMEQQFQDALNAARVAPHWQPDPK